MSDHTFFSAYYERTFSEPEMRNAFYLYQAWNVREGYKPELESLVFLEWFEVGSAELWSTVLYHAEIEQQHRAGETVNYCTDVVALPEKKSR
jgi:hypothetical protein